MSVMYSLTRFTDPIRRIMGRSITMVMLWMPMVPLLSQAQIGTDHIRIVTDPTAGPFGLAVIIDQEYDGEPNRFDGQTHQGDQRDYTGINFSRGIIPIQFRFEGSWLDDGVSVYVMDEGDTLSEALIEAGTLKELAFGEQLDFSEPVLLGFRTPIYRPNIDPIFGGALRGLGWAKIQVNPLEPGPPLLELLDHAMVYGSDHIVVGGDQNQTPEPESKIPVSRLGDREVLLDFEQNAFHWTSGDFNGDGRLDFLLSDGNNGLQLWKQLPDHSYAKHEGPSITGRGRPDGIGDFDGDGDLDVWVSARGWITLDPHASVWLNDGLGNFTATTQEFPANDAAHLGDLDNDGDLDAIVMVSNETFQTEIQTWLNQGNGQFEYLDSMLGLCGPSSIPAALGDINGDGFVDMAYACAGGVRQAINQHDGRLVDIGRSYVNGDILTIFQGANLAMGDLDGHLGPDVVIPLENLSTGLWFNNGQGELLLGRSSMGTGNSHALLGDLDLDGDLDVLMHKTHSFGNSGETKGCRFYLNLGPDAFSNGEHIEVTDGINGPRLLDIDQDDDLDLVIKDGGKLVVYRNSIEYLDPPQGGEDSVHIPDTALKHALLRTLQKPLTAEVTEKDLLGLELLDLSRMTRGPTVPAIRDFTGLEKATQLTWLNLSGGDLSGQAFAIPNVDTDQFEFLSSLKQLRSLRLDQNQLTALNLPDGLSQLTELNLSDNQFETLDLPAGFSELKILHLGSNRLRQLALHEDMLALEVLLLESNQINTVEIPEAFTNLKQLNLSDNGTTRLGFPPEASGLEWLNLGGNQFRRLTLPEDLGNLDWLALGNSARTLPDYQFLTQCTALKYLQVIDRDFDLGELDAPLDHLEILEVDMESSDSFVLPPGYDRLRELTIVGPLLKHIGLPPDLNRLEHLDLQAEGMELLDLPRGLVVLNRLKVSGGTLRGITFPDDMSQLRDLDLTQNQIETLIIPEGVGAAPKAPQVYLYGNPIRLVRTPGNWSNNIHSDAALLLLDELRFDSSGNLRVIVKGSIGKLVVEKSNDLIHWQKVREFQIDTPNARKLFRDPDALAAPAGFYRVYMEP